MNKQGKKVYKTTAVQCDQSQLAFIVLACVYCLCLRLSARRPNWLKKKNNSYSALLLTAADRCKKAVQQTISLKNHLAKGQQQIQWKQPFQETLTAYPFLPLHRSLPVDANFNFEKKIRKCGQHAFGIFCGCSVGVVSRPKTILCPLGGPPDWPDPAAALTEVLLPALPSLYVRLCPTRQTLHRDLFPLAMAHFLFSPVLHLCLTRQREIFFYQSHRFMISQTKVG